MKLTHLLLLALIVALPFNSIAADNDDDDLLLFTVPVIAAATRGEPEVFPPEWGVFMENVACQSSVITFAATVDSVTKSSSTPAGGGEATFSGFSVSTPGLKNVTSTLTSATCLNFVANFSIAFEDGFRYLFVLRPENGQLSVVTFAQEITVPSNKTSKVLKTSDMMEVLMQTPMMVVEGETKAMQLDSN